MIDEIFSNTSDTHTGFDFRAKNTLCGGVGFILPDYFDTISAGATAEVYEAVMSLLQSGNEEHFRDLLSQHEGVGVSPSYGALVYFLMDTLQQQVRNAIIH